MATFKATVLKNKVRKDGTYNVKIRLTHERKTSYISTEHYVSKKQLTKALDLKDGDLIKVLDKTIESYRSKLLKLSGKIHLFTAVELADWLVKETESAGVDFIAFSQRYIDEMKNNGKTGNAANLQTALNALKDFLQTDKISIDEITSKLLPRFEKYLTSERVIERYYKPGELVKRTLKPITGVGLFDYMRRIRQLFIAAQDEYNDQDRGEIVIKHYPFKKYKIPEAPNSEKRNLEVEQLKAIRDLKDIPDNGNKGTNLCEFSKDVFMLSFYLVGINSVDLYNATELKKGALIYKRTKTRTRRKDEAKISIKIEPEVLPLLEKYKSDSRVFDFHTRYKNYRTFNKALNEGLKQVAKLTKIEKLEFYHARGTWASIAKNKCKISTDDIAFSLNHSRPEHRITNIYIETDFTLIAEANRKVLDYIK